MLFNQRKGMENELKAQLYFMQKGYDIFAPRMQHTRADFIAVQGQEVLRVQVKTVQENGDHLQSRLDVKGTRYTKEDTDVLFFVYGDRMWLAPIEDVAGRPSICFGRIDGQVVNNVKREYNPDGWIVQ